jgi:hypothetical protein
MVKIQRRTGRVFRSKAAALQSLLLVHCETHREALETLFRTMRRDE